MPPAPAHYLILDVEATPGDGRTILDSETETIEIGAFLVDAATLAPLAEFQSFVRPVRHPILTPFCNRLTGIKQADVDPAPLFPAAFAALHQRLLAGRADVVFGSWGDFDEKQLRRDCEYHRVPYTLPAHVDLKELFSRAQVRKRRYGVESALAACGLKHTGAVHRALDDARCVVRLLPWIFGGKIAPPEPPPPGRPR